MDPQVYMPDRTRDSAYSILILGLTFVLVLVTPVLLQAAYSPDVDFQQITISGTVTDIRTGEPLPGANILVEGTTIGTSADLQGFYEISDLEPGSYVLLFRYIGYVDTRREIEISEDGPVTFHVELEREAVGLDELVVTATGSVRSREVGTSQARLTAAEFAAASASNPQEILSGRVAGATVLANSGQPGAGGTIRLRGNNSISQSNNPIIYIDGIRVEGGDSPSHQASRQTSSPLNDINPNDIESIDIVKGAAATTLYGTEASGGVIRISTKQGSEGVTIWNASVTSGFNNMPHFGPRKDNPTGLFMGRCRGDGLESYDGVRFEEVNCPESGSWLQNGLVQRYNLNVSSGIDGFTYYVSANYKSEDGVIHDAGGDAGAGFRGNFRFTPLENVSVSYNTSYNQAITDWLPEGNNGDGFVLNVSRGPGGNFSGADGCSDQNVACVDNSEIIESKNQSTREHFINSLVLEVNSGDRLTNRVTLGYDYNNYELESTQYFGYSRTPLGQQSLVNWNKSVLSFEYLGTLQLSISQNVNSTLNWGGQLYQNDTSTQRLFSEDFSGPQEPTLTSGARTSVTGDTKIRVATGGFFGQAMFNYDDQLFITLGARVDGHSAFGDNYGLQFYPKVSASYVLSDYDFWPVEWWNTFRVRAAVGESGQAPGAFDAVRTWSPVAGEDGQPGFTPNQIGNPDLGPERSREFETGFMAGFFQGRVNADVTYYNQTTTDALIPVPAVASEGFLSSQVQNIGELKNSGLEAELEITPVRSSDLDWSLRFGYSKEKSEAVDLGDVTSITIETFGNTYIRQGYPVPSIIGAVITNPDEIADPVYDEDQFIGPAYPDQSISLGTTLRFRENLILDSLGEFKMGGYMVNGTAYQNTGRGIWPPCYAAQRGDINSLTAMDRAQCALTGGPITRRYDHWIESTDFFRLRHVTLTYILPRNWIPENVRSASIAITARNLFTITDYQGTDPELDDFRNSLARRDYYNMPTYRTFLATLNFTF